MFSQASSRKKKVRSNSSQLDHLVDFMETHTSFANGKTSNNQTGVLWIQLTKEINVKGDERDAKNWSKTWADIVRSAKQRREFLIDGSRDTPLSDFDLRVLKITEPKCEQPNRSERDFSSPKNRHSQFSKKRSYSPPWRGRSRSTAHSRSPSGVRKRSRSHSRSRPQMNNWSHSPIHKRSCTPVRRRSRSPTTHKSKYLERSPSRSPKRSRDYPIVERSPSPTNLTLNNSTSQEDKIFQKPGCSKWDDGSGNRLTTVDLTNSEDTRSPKKSGAVSQSKPNSSDFSKKNNLKVSPIANTVQNIIEATEVQTGTIIGVVKELVDCFKQQNDILERGFSRVSRNFDENLNQFLKEFAEISRNSLTVEAQNNPLIDKKKPLN